MLRKFICDRRGVAAVEMAIVTPVLIGLICLAINAGQLMSLKANTNFAAQAGAMAGQARVAEIVAANAPLFLNGATFDLAITSAPTTFTVTLNTSEPALWPFFVDRLTSSSTVTLAIPGT